MKQIKQIDTEKNRITYNEGKYIRIVYGEYSETADITFIMQDIIKKETEKCISTEVVGFYYGEPELEWIEKFYGSLKTEF